MQRPPRLATRQRRIGLFGSLECAFFIQRDDGVERRVVLSDMVQVSLFTTSTAETLRSRMACAN